MSRSRHTEAEMIAALKQMKAGRKTEDVVGEVGVSKHTLYAWKANYGGMDASQAQEAEQLRDENSRLRKLVATCRWAKRRCNGLDTYVGSQNFCARGCAHAFALLRGDEDVEVLEGSCSL